MVTISKTLLATLALAFLASCTTELKVQTKAVEADCQQFPDSPECAVTESLNLSFKIITEHFVTNAEEAAFKWEPMTGSASYEIIVARDKTKSAAKMRYPTGSSKPNAT
mgnify:CR=1 FL=1